MTKAGSGLLVAFATAALFAQTPQGTAIVTGSVVDAVTGRPVAGAHVTLAYHFEGSARRGSYPPPSRSTETGRTGSFAIEYIVAAEYSVEVSAHNYLYSRFGARRPNGSGVPIEIGEGARVEDLTIALWPEASIEGQVTDARGRPIVKAQVVAADRGRGTYQASAMTDDRGSYRISGLAPGTYTLFVRSQMFNRTLSAEPPLGRSGPAGADSEPYLVDRDGHTLLLLQGSLPPPPLPDGRPQLYVTSYFGGTTARDAAAVALRAGETRTNVDITMEARLAVRVSGIVTGPDGPVPGAMVSLQEEGSQLNDVSRIDVAATPDGAFTFVLVPRGQYVLTARRHLPPLTDVRLDTRGRPLLAMDDVIVTDPDSLWAEMPVTIGDAEISGLAVAMRAGTPVTGRMVFNESGGGDPRAGSGFVRFLRMDDPDVYGGQHAAISTPGTFSARLRPGQYRIEAGGAGSLWFAGARLDGREIGEGPIDVGSEPIQTLEIVLDGQPTVLGGTVSSGPGGAAADATVVVLPADTRAPRGLSHDSPRTRMRRTYSGRFDIRGLVPGEYFVVAVDDAALAEMSSADVGRLTKRARKMRLAIGETVMLNLIVEQVSP